ncbi:MAG TPA: AsmA-like C-terminal region-containing protein [Dongiaceae bacterium]|nr:AsmA-like C-terminal region-containing protein [Dongiaceae bacterium]
MNETHNKPAKTSILRQHPVVAGCCGLVLLLLVAAIGAAWFIATMDYRPFAAQRLSAMLGRQVKIGGLATHWSGALKGEPLAIEMQDLHVANIPGGSAPDMMTVKSIAARLDVRALLQSRLVFQQLRIDQPVLVLERDAAGHGNWQFGDPGKAANDQQQNLDLEAEPRPDAVEPVGRRDFPILLDFILTDGQLSYRTFHDHILRITLHQVAIKTGGEDQPVNIEASGAYNDAEMTLQAVTGSFRDLHATDKPLPADFTLARQSAKLHFKGTLVDPLNVDGADGALHVETQKLDGILTVFRTQIGIDPAAALDTHLTRQGDLWRLADAKGDLGGNAFAGQFKLLEGRRGGNDRMKLEARFDELALDKLLAADKETPDKKAGNWRDISLQAPDKTSPYLATMLSATKLTYQSMSAQDITLQGSLAPDKIVLDSARLTLSGVPLQLTGTLASKQDGGRLAAVLQMKDAEFQALAKLLGNAPPALSGKISGGIDLALQGKTLSDGLKSNSGSAVLSMQNGRISRDLLEKASTDLRNVFRKGEGTAVVNCLLAVMHLQNGIGQVAPAKLRSTAATLNAAGRVDFRNQTLDLTLQSDRNSTGFLALDLPVRLRGSWSQPKVDLLRGGGPAVASSALGDLPPALQGVAVANSCKQ